MEFIQVVAMEISKICYCALLMNVALAFFATDNQVKLEKSLIECVLSIVESYFGNGTTVCLGSPENYNTFRNLSRSMQVMDVNDAVQKQLVTNMRWLFATKGGNRDMDYTKV